MQFVGDGLPESAQSRRGPVRFGVFEVDLHAGELRKQGVKIKLQDQPFQVLQALLEKAGQVVSREELQHRIWPADTFVDFDQGLSNAIKRLREALGDSAETPRFVETIPRRGYRFLADFGAVRRPTGALAVLPLEDLSHDPHQEYFAEGLTEALITTLAKIGDLRVISRTSVMQYKGVHKPIREIARELGVEMIVEGTVLRIGDRVRITAQLVDASHETHLWAESYERDLRDVFALQSELAQAIAREIRVKLTPQEQAQLTQVRQVDPEAYEAYLKGRYHWARRSGSELPKAVQFFQQAIARDPTYAAAYAGLADSLSGLGVYFVAPEDGCGKAKKMAQRALEIDHGLAEAHASLAWATLWYDYDFETVEKEFERAIELNPRYPAAHIWYGFSLAMMGRHDEAYTELKRAVRLDPHNTYTYTTFGFVCYSAHRYEQALEQFEKSIELDPGIAQSYCGLGWVYLRQGLPDRSIAAAEKSLQLSPGATLFLGSLAEAQAAAGKQDEAQRTLAQVLETSKLRYVTPYIMARIHTALGNKDEAFAWLETGYRERAAVMVFLRTDPLFDVLHSDSRFQSLLRRMNFPE